MDGLPQFVLTEGFMWGTIIVCGGLWMLLKIVEVVWNKLDKDE